jgi:hypothetical protein
MFLYEQILSTPPFTFFLLRNLFAGFKEQRSLVDSLGKGSKAVRKLND